MGPQKAHMPLSRRPLPYDSFQSCSDHSYPTRQHRRCSQRTGGNGCGGEAAVATASSNVIGWSTVESLTGSSWRDYCTDEKHALVVKHALATQERRATDAYERDQKHRDRKGRGGRRDHDADGYRGRRKLQES